MPIYPGRRAGTWRVLVYARQKLHETIVEGSKTLASQTEARMRLELAAGPHARSRWIAPPFSTLSSLYKSHAELHLGANTWRKVRAYQVATLVGFFGATKLDELSLELIDEFKRQRLADGLEPTSVNNELRVLGTMLKWGREDRGLPIPILKIRKLKTGKRRVRSWTLDEVRRVYRSATRIYPSIVPLLHFLLETGCRKGEALAAEWTWVDLERQMLRIPVTRFWRPKDGEAREVPLSDALVAMLRERPRRTSWVFPRSGTHKHPLGQYQTFPEKLWRKITKDAKVLGGPHTTRHTFASHFLAARPDLSLLAKVMGHSTTYVTELYTHLLPDHLAQARNAVQLAPPGPTWAKPKPKTLAKTLADKTKYSMKSTMRH